MKVLVINAGSSSLKYQLIDMEDESVMAKGLCERIGIGGHLNLERVYSFDPYEDLDEETCKYIKGIQANVWTEYLASFDRVQERTLPRIAAVAEIAWGASNRTDYQNFVQRVQKALLPLYEEAGYKYVDYAFREPAVE